MITGFFRFFCISHATRPIQPLEVVLPNAEEPVFVVVVSEVGDVERELAGERIRHHAYLDVGSVVYVVPVPTYAGKAVDDVDGGCAHLMMACVVAPRQCELSTFKVRTVGYPLRHTLAGGDELPNDAFRC